MRRLGNFLGFAICAAMLGFAYYLQFGPRELTPCPLCIFERFATAALALVFLIAWLHNPKRFGRWIYAGLILVVAAVGTFIAARHVYIQLHPESVMSCGGASLRTMIEHLPAVEVIRQVLRGSGECAHVDKVLGFTLPGWVLVAMVALGVGGIAANSRR